MAGTSGSGSPGLCGQLVCQDGEDCAGVWGRWGGEYEGEGDVDGGVAAGGGGGAEGVISGGFIYLLGLC